MFVPDMALILYTLNIGLMRSPVLRHRMGYFSSGEQRHVFQERVVEIPAAPKGKISYSKRRLIPMYLLSSTVYLEVIYFVHTRCLETNTSTGTLDFYFFSGPSPQKVIEQYSELVGTQTWVPAWAFGFHLCRYRYFLIINF